MTAHRREFDDQSNGHFAPIAMRTHDDYALVIGVNHYPQLRPLRGAIADARAFADWLMDPMGGNVPQKNVFTILSSPDPLAPVGHEMNDALEAIFARAEKSGAGRLYFYFSGHSCVGDRASDLALCLANWSNLRRRAALSSDAWVDVVVRSGLFAEVAVFLDCCRVWATRAVGLPPQIDFVKPLERAHSTRVFVAYATEYQRAALEVAEPSAEVRGIFTRVLIDGLQSKACNESGKVSATSLKHYLEKSTQERALALGLHQRAEVVNGFEEGAHFGPSQFKPGAHRPSPQESIPVASMRRNEPSPELYCAPSLFTKQEEAQLLVVLFHSTGKEWSVHQRDLAMKVQCQLRTARDQERAEAWCEIVCIAKPGAYVLRYSGRSPREIAVHLFPGSTTQVVIEDAGNPRFENTHVIVAASNKRHDPLVVARGLALLDSGTNELPPEWTAPIRDVNLANPMRDLIAAHLLSRTKTPDAPRIQALVDRAEAHLGPCPDVQALRLRLALLVGQALPKSTYSDPPMLREGLLAFVEASHKYPELIAPASLLEYACVERLVDSPLSSWPIRGAHEQSDDWLSTIVDELATKKGGDTSTLEATTIARELGVPTRSITTRIEITRQRTQATKIPSTTPLELIRSVSTDSLEIRGYTLQRVIGKGGMGRVYLAKRIATNESVAIKVMLPQSAVSKDARQRFLREISVMSALKHERIADLQEFGEAKRCFYFVTSYYPEGNLAEWVRRNGRPTIERAIKIMLDVLKGLAYAHQRGYVHRDIKPQNILLDVQGRGVVADFGLAKSFEESGFGDITKSGTTAGTAAYMPREQIVNFKRVRPSTDVWAAAAVLYWLLCGFHARELSGSDSSFLSVLRSPLVPIRTRAIQLPDALSDLVDRALADDPNGRPDHAGAFRVELENALADVPLR